MVVKKYVVETVFDDMFFYLDTKKDAYACAAKLNRFFADYAEFLGNPEVIPSLPVAFVKKNRKVISDGS